MRVLHVSHHFGCQSDFQYVAKQLGLDLEFYQYPHGYNIGHERAKFSWEEKADFFNSFDVIVTSDTAPLSRIFLQNNFSKRLIIWVCNRFNYTDYATLDCNFPDGEYFSLFAQACADGDRVAVYPYTAFEYEFAKAACWIDMPKSVIKPLGLFLEDKIDENVPAYQSPIPSTIDREATFFLPFYHNDPLALDKLQEWGVPCYRGRYAGPKDLRKFRAIVHMPYAWSNFAFFENIQNGIPYLIPSLKFLLENYKNGYWFCDFTNFQHLGHIAEWYQPQHQKFITYFDSWDDLRHKIESVDFNRVKDDMADFCDQHTDQTLKQWEQAFGV